jgi:hypothetical protein
MNQFITLAVAENCLLSTQCAFLKSVPTARTVNASDRSSNAREAKPLSLEMNWGQDNPYKHDGRCKQRPSCLTSRAYTGSLRSTLALPLCVQRRYIGITFSGQADDVEGAIPFVVILVAEGPRAPGDGFG